VWFINFSGKFREILFQYDTSTDTPQSVVEQMHRDLQLPPSLLSNARKVLEQFGKPLFFYSFAS
jgi:hypothetical protein